MSIFKTTLIFLSCIIFQQQSLPLDCQASMGISSSKYTSEQIKITSSFIMKYIISNNYSFLIGSTICDNFIFLKKIGMQYENFEYHFLLASKSTPDNTISRIQHTGFEIKWHYSKSLGIAICLIKEIGIIIRIEFSASFSELITELIIQTQTNNDNTPSIINPTNPKDNQNQIHPQITETKS